MKNDSSDVKKYRILRGKVLLIKRGFYLFITNIFIMEFRYHD